MRERIVSGRYAVDSNAPSEADLCEEFGVSRYTVREALRKLAELGYVRRKRGTRTQVVSSNPASYYSQSMYSLSELFQYALKTHFQIDSARIVALDAEQAELVGAGTGSEWLRIQGLRRTEAGGRIICFTAAYINIRFAWLKEELLASAGPMYALIEARGEAPIAEATQTFRAVEMPPDVRAAFGHPDWPVALRLVRRYVSETGDVLVASVNDHPADRFSYTMRIQREALS